MGLYFMPGADRMAARCLDCKQDATVDHRCYFHNKQHVGLIEPSCQYPTLTAAKRDKIHEHEILMDPDFLAALLSSGKAIPLWLEEHFIRLGGING
jgi:hypothetical protein